MFYIINYSSSKQVGSQISLSSVIALWLLVPCCSSLLMCAGDMGADIGISLPCSYTNPVYICWLEKDHRNRKIQQSKNMIYYECSEDSNWPECCLKGNNQPEESQDKYLKSIGVFYSEICWEWVSNFNVHENQLINLSKGRFIGSIPPNSNSLSF